MQRRQLLRHFVASVACTCPVCGTLLKSAAVAASETAQPHWTYEGHGGPEEWGKLAPEYAACGMGREQSPIDLARGTPAMMGDPAVSWQPGALEVVNNGHTIQVNCPKGSTLALDGNTYELLQYHFHHPSEHTIAGVTFDMEVHFVHRNAENGLAVLGVMIKAGEANPAIETIWRMMPALGGETARSDAALHPGTMLPTDSTTYRYAGSLTTPPCSEVVSWVVYRHPITASADQIARFAKLFPNNARPVQQLHRRKLLLDVL
ncbi:MAG: carbonic anhydrase family protein [Magnetospirillum sp.]|nr:carbonic anhydrase family protein [Magnetospirillum sp.]